MEISDEALDALIAELEAIEEAEKRGDIVYVDGRLTLGADGQVAVDGRSLADLLGLLHLCRVHITVEHDG